MTTADWDYKGWLGRMTGGTRMTGMTGMSEITGMTKND